MLRPLYLACFVLLLISCRKNNLSKSQDICPISSQSPRTYYLGTELQEVEYNQSHCGYFPLSKKNYWVYLDSVFDQNGVFQYSKIDTLRFTRTHRTPDSLIWWSPNIQIGFIRYNYSTDSMLYSLGHNWGARPAIQWFYPIDADSTEGWVSMSDVSSYFIAKKIVGTYTIPAGIFDGCTNYIKIGIMATSLGHESVFKPQVGILRCRLFEGISNPVTRQTWTLLGFYLE